MTYRKKILCLSVLVLILAIIFIFSLVFDPQKQKGKSFAWLPQGMLNMVSDLEIYGSGNDKIVLSRKNNAWVFLKGTEELPVKQGRVEDLLSALAKKEIYPLRAGSAEARERLALVEGRASRIIVRGGAGLPLLDLLIGTADVLNRNIYLKRADRNEIYSGEDRFTMFTEGKPNSWYDLRLFREPIRVDSVEQVDIVLPEGNLADRLPSGQIQQQVSAGREGEVSYTIRRSGGGWYFPGNESQKPNNNMVDAWLRSVVEAEGEDFGNDPPINIEGSLVLWLGDGTNRFLHIGSMDENGRRKAIVSEGELRPGPAAGSGSSLVFIFSEWTIKRLFRDGPYFTN